MSEDNKRTKKDAPLPVEREFWLPTITDPRTKSDEGAEVESDSNSGDSK